MITIKFGILLAISLLPPPVVETGGKRKGKKGKASKKISNKNTKKTSKKSTKKTSKKDKSSKGSKKSKINKKPAVVKPEYVYDVGKPKGYFHIEYVLLPKGPQYRIDVVFWDNFSKVFTDDGVVIYRHCIKNDRIWIPVMLEHNFGDFNIEKLLALHSYAFEVLIIPNKKKLGKNAKGEKTKVFYVKEAELENDSLIQAFDFNPNVENIVPTTQNLDTKKIEASKINDGFHSKIIVFENSILFPRMKKIIEQVSKCKEISSKEYIPNAPGPIPVQYQDYDDNEVEHITWKVKKSKKAGKGGKKEKKKAKKAKKKPKKGTKKGGKKKEGKCAIKISGETFFTDPMLSVYDLKQPHSKVEKAYVIMSTCNLLSKGSKVELNPLVIKLKTMDNLPVDILKKEGFTSIYLQYNIPYVCRTSTLTKTLIEKIKFNESHAYFHVPSDKLLQFLQTQMLRVELVGIREKDKLQPHLFNGANGDCAYTKVDPKTYFDEKPTVMVLAAACFNLSIMQNTVNKLQLLCPFRHPDNILVQKATDIYENVRITNPVTINDINFSVVPKTQHRSPLNDSILLSHGTCLKIEAWKSEPFEEICHLKLISNAFRRMFIIVYSEEIAAVILNEILLHNQFINSEVLLPNLFPHGNVYDHIDTKSKILTGFVIDNGCSYIFFLECTTINYAFETIWSQVQKMNESICRVFHNSEHIYPKRIYETYISLGGVVKVALKVPLQDIFKIPFAYLKGNVPEPALQAIIKLESMLRAQTMMEINQYCLYPTASELISFVAEFGVAYRMG